MKEMKIPPLSDPRYLQTAILMAYSFAARQFFYIERAHFVSALCVAWAIMLDQLLGALVFKKRVFPLSAVIIGLSSSILLDARHWSYYLLAVTVAICSKALITYSGRHIFNPTNFAVVALLQLAPGKVAGMANLFSGYFWPSIIFAVLGTINTIYARKEDASFTFLGGFVVFGLLRAWLLGSSLLLTIGPVLSSSMLLFSFHMINDPATTPANRKHRIIFCLATAALDAVFRYHQIPFGMFYALFLVSALTPLAGLVRSWAPNAVEASS